MTKEEKNVVTPTQVGGQCIIILITIDTGLRRYDEFFCLVVGRGMQYDGHVWIKKIPMRGIFIDDIILFRFRFLRINKLILIHRLVLHLGRYSTFV